MADRIEVRDGTGYIEQAPGPDGPTYFIRLGTERLTPRAAGDLIIDPNVAAIDWETGWVYPTLLNSWVNYGTGFTAARYRKSAGSVVHIEGLVKNGTINTNVFILAAGYRPSYRLIACSMDTGNNDPERLDILNDGGVRPVTGSTGWQTLMVTFFAEA